MNQSFQEFLLIVMQLSIGNTIKKNSKFGFQTRNSNTRSCSWFLCLSSVHLLNISTTWCVSHFDLFVPQSWISFSQQWAFAVVEWISHASLRCFRTFLYVSLSRWGRLWTTLLLVVLYKIYKMQSVQGQVMQLMSTVVCVGMLWSSRHLWWLNWSQLRWDFRLSPNCWIELGQDTSS